VRQVIAAFTSQAPHALAFGAEHQRQRAAQIEIVE
jgi:hypothetical protein